LNALKGKTYFEAELYELLLFDIEENFIDYIGHFVHLYFERAGDGKIKVNEIVHFENNDFLDQKSRSIIEKQEWFQIVENQNHIDLLLVRFDRTGSVPLFC
jgi:hypothetical protein